MQQWRRKIAPRPAYIKIGLTISTPRSYILGADFLLLACYASAVLVLENNFKIVGTQIPEVPSSITQWHFQQVLIGKGDA